MKKHVRLYKIYGLRGSRHKRFLRRLPGRIGLAANPLGSPRWQMLDSIARTISLASRLMKAHSLRIRWYYPNVQFAFALPILLRTVLRVAATRHSSQVVIRDKRVPHARDLIQYFFSAHSDSRYIRAYPWTPILSGGSVAAKEYVNTVVQRLGLYYPNRPALKQLVMPKGLTRTSVEVQKMGFAPMPYVGESRLGMVRSARPAITPLLKLPRLTHSIKTLGFGMKGILRPSNTHNDLFIVPNQIARLSYEKGSARIHDRGWSPSATIVSVSPLQGAPDSSHKGVMTNPHNAAYAVKSTVAPSASIGQTTRREPIGRYSPVMAFTNVLLLGQTSIDGSTTKQASVLPRLIDNSTRQSKIDTTLQRFVRHPRPTAAAARPNIVHSGNQTSLTIIKPLTVVRTTSIDGAESRPGIAGQASEAPGLVHRQQAYLPATSPIPEQGRRNDSDIAVVPQRLPAGIAEAPMVSRTPDIQHLTDQVIQVIESRLQTERERRGIFI
jgi:hypothetical protein